MEWLFHILFLTSCRSLVSLPVNPKGTDCRILPPSTELNMAENSAAFYFSRSQASDDLAIKFLKKDLGKNVTFVNIWEQATASLKGKTGKKPGGLRKEHVIAMTAYTIHRKIGGSLYSSLNDGVRSYGGDLTTYNACFNLKSFHYLLSVALQVLRNSSIGPLVYRGTESQVAGTLGTEMRFGIFASTSFNKKVAEGFDKFGNGTVFEIKTSYGVDLRKFTVNVTQEEVMIPPYEKFKITESSGGNRYTLNSTGYKGVEVELQSDGSGLKIVYSAKTPWWVLFLTALGILVFLGGVGGLTWYGYNKSS